MLKRALLYLVVMLILLALAVSAGQWDKSTALLQQHADELSIWLTKQENENAGTVLTHQRDSLLSWSNTSVIPTSRDLKEWSDKTGTSLLQLPQGWFFARFEKSGDAAKTTLIPIRYRLNNKDLNNNHLFPANPSIPSSVLISASKTDYPINFNGQAIGWLTAVGPVNSAWLQWLKLGAWLLFFGVFLSLLSQIAKALGEKYGWLTGAMLVALVSTALLWLNLSTGFSAKQFGALSLFAQNFEGASLIGASVGDWLIHGLLLVYVMAFFHQSKASYTENGKILGDGTKLGLSIFSYLLAMLSILIGSEAIRQLVFKNRLGFDFDHILNLGLLGFLAIAGVVALMVGLFLFSHRLAIGVQRLQLSQNQRYTAIGAATLAFSALCFLIGPAETNLAWTIGFSLDRKSVV